MTSLPYHTDLPSGSEVISGGHTGRQTDDLISLLSFLESRLTIKIITVSYKYDT
jgi:hypothetical protein